MKFLRPKDSPYAAVKWDKEKNKPLYEFIRGQFETDDPETIKILLDMGFATEPPMEAHKTAEGEPEKAEDSKNPHAVVLGHLGGIKGGPARAKKLSPEQRSQIARKASRARWDKKSNSL